MKDIKRLANQFREAIEVAKEEREFYKDIVFRNFPIGCCGDTCDLLAQFLLDKDIEIYCVYIAAIISFASVSSTILRKT